VWQTDGQTDGRAIAYSALSMLSRAKKHPVNLNGGFFCNRVKKNSRSFPCPVLTGQARFLPAVPGQKLWNTAAGWGVNQSHAMFMSCSRHVTQTISVVRAFLVTKWSVNKVNEVLPVYICTLLILCDHERLSAIVEWTQSDHSDCRQWMKGVSTTKPGTESFLFNTWSIES